MALSDVHPYMKWLLSAHELFRRLGFTPDELFVGYLEEHDALYLKLQHGEQEFVWAEESKGFNEQLLLTLWPPAVALWNGSEPEEALDIYNNSGVLEKQEDLIMALIQKGIIPPIVHN